MTSGGGVVATAPAAPIPLLTRLYVWSVILEPLLFFVIVDRTVAGISGNLSRLLQAVVAVGLMMRMARRFNATRWLIPSPAGRLYQAYSLHVLVALGAGLLGYWSGAYQLTESYTDTAGESWVSLALNSAVMRPFVEYAIAAYYFAYFVVLPQYLLPTPQMVRYFLRTFAAMFFVSLALGFIDLALSASGTPLLPRHISDWRTVDVRYHGLAGEPRQAFVYLFLGLAMLHLRAFVRGESLGSVMVAAIGAAALLTQSASGMLGMAAFVGLYALYGLRRAGVNSVFRVAALVVVTAAVAYVSVANSSRMMAYLSPIAGLWPILESGAQLPFPMNVQADNIYPLYDLTVKARDLDLVPVLIGSGMGSASVVTNLRSAELSGMVNPNSQLVRLLFETGLIGTLLFIAAFVSPMAYMTRRLSAGRQHQFMLMTLLVLGCTLGQRSSAIFIYLGACIAAYRVGLIEAGQQR